MVKTEQKMKRNLIHIEILRIIAIYLVMFNHTGAKGFFLFSVAQDSMLYPVYLFISIADKIAVPIFFMISGALLLGKAESIKDIYKKRVLRFVIILAGISFYYNIYNWYYYGAELNLKQYFINLYSQDASVALWYLYSYLGILVMLPMLRRMAKAMEAKEFVYLAIAQIVVVGILPIMQYVLSVGTVSLNGSFSVPIITGSNIFYFLMGYYFEKVLGDDKYTLKNVLIANFAGIVAIMVTCIVTHYRVQVMGECSEAVSQVFHSSLITIPTFAVYYTVKFVFLKFYISSRWKKWIQFVGSTTFGIYLFEGMLRERTQFIFVKLQPYIKTMPASLVWIAFAFVLGCLMTAILKKIPGVKKCL